MAAQAAKAQTAEANVNNLLMTMGAKVDEAVNSSIAALLHTDSHVVAGVLETSMAIQELEFAFDQAVFSALERGSLAETEAMRLTTRWSAERWPRLMRNAPTSRVAIAPRTVITSPNG